MRKRNRGFTLLELMLVLTIAGLLIGLGLPAMGDFIRTARMTSAANDMIATLNHARSEAIKRRAAVTVCATDSPFDEPPRVPECADGNDISGLGWIAFVDANRNGQVDVTSFNDTNGNGEMDLPEPDTNGDGNLDPAEDLNGNGVRDAGEEATGIEEVIRRREPLHGAIEAAGTAAFRVTYLDTGFMAVGGANSIVMCDSRGNEPSVGELSAARGIRLAATGRPEVTRDKAEIATLGGCP